MHDYMICVCVCVCVCVCARDKSKFNTIIIILYLAANCNNSCLVTKITSPWLPKSGAGTFGLGKVERVIMKKLLNVPT